MPAFTDLLTSLGWSLLDSIWQMAMLWMLYCMLTVYNKRFSAAGKYNLALVFIFIGSEWFVYTLIHLIREPRLSYLPGFISISPSVNYWMPFLSIIYLFVLTFRFLQQVFQNNRRILKDKTKKIEPLLQSFTDRYVLLLGITKKVHVYLSELAETAETSGFLKPIILLPLSIVTRLTPQQLESIILHELLHIRRNDYLINILMYVFRCVFFFNPFASLFYHAITKERELACDDGVIALNYPPEQYAEALFTLEKFRYIDHGFAIAADGNKPWLLMERIQRVLGRPVAQKKRVTPFLLFSFVFGFVLFGLKQKTVEPVFVSPMAARPTPIFTARYESAPVKIQLIEKRISGKTGVRNKTRAKTREVADQIVQVDSDLERNESADAVNEAYFADNHVARNFTNEQAVGMNTDPIQASPGTPYIPSASLSYEDLPDNLIRQDSIRDILIQNTIKKLVIKTRIQTVVTLKQLQVEMEKNKKQLRQLQMKDKQLMHQHQKSIKPILEQIQQQLKLGKQRIDQLQTQLQASEEEIIHI